MLRVKAVVSGMSVSLKGNAPVTKTRKMLEGHVKVCLDISAVMIILVKAGFTFATISGVDRCLLMTFLSQYANIHGFFTMDK